VPFLTLAASGFPRPACGERAKSTGRKQEFGLVRGRFHKLRIAVRPPHPNLLPARGEKETALRPGCVRTKRQSHNTKADSGQIDHLGVFAGLAPAIHLLRKMLYA
jgi:hypothetical protein